jgi:hypothetical protein
MVMLEVARPEARTGDRSHPAKLSWGIVDVILALVMLPFGIWMFIIESMVNGITWLLNRPFEPRRQA